MLNEPEEECELEQLVPVEDDQRLCEPFGEVTPPVSPGVSKITQTSPTAPINKQMSTSGGPSSVRSVGSQSSSSSRTLNHVPTALSISSSHSNSANPGSGTRLIYVNEKLNSRPARPPPPQLSSRTQSIKRDVTDVRRMETALLHLLEDFHSGKLRAFGKDCSMEQMTGIREQQEHLARLHFEIGAQQESYSPLSEEGLRKGAENMNALMSSLEHLSESIERLHSSNS
uniref:Coiled-coil domain-containing protein 28B n=1 Tax=Clastoptera arizonana TaxID=38151 RepID=A0A1B6DXL7_9HEMI